MKIHYNKTQKKIDRYYINTIASLSLLAAIILSYVACTPFAKAKVPGFPVAEQHCGNFAGWVARFAQAEDPRVLYQFTIETDPDNRDVYALALDYSKKLTGDPAEKWAKANSACLYINQSLSA